MKAPTRGMRYLALATTVLGMAHCPAAAAGQARHRLSHLVVVTHHAAAQHHSLPPASFPDPAGLALLLNPDSLALADAEDGATVLTVRPPVALADLDQLRAPPIADPQPATPPPLPVTPAERLAAAAPPPIVVPPDANIAVLAPPVVLTLATPLPVPPPAPVVAPPVAAPPVPPPPPVRMAAVTPLPPPPPPPARRIARRAFATPARAQAVVRPPRTYTYYAPRYEPPPPPYGVLIGPPRGYGYGYGYWGGYGYY